MIKLGVLHAYEHTEAFVRDVCAKIFAQAFVSKFNIIMECAFDSIDFANFPPSATIAGYQFETHIVGCNQAFAHVSSIKRAFNSLKEKQMERFLTSSALDASMSNAQAIILALETAAKAVSGSQITLYERGFGELKERTLRAQSLYTRDADDELVITGSPAPYSYGAYGEIINNPVYTMGDRDEIVKSATWRCSRPACTTVMFLASYATTCMPTLSDTCTADFCGEHCFSTFQIPLCRILQKNNPAEMDQ